jgi:hypothetical protein
VIISACHSVMIAIANLNHFQEEGAAFPRTSPTCVLRKYYPWRSIFVPANAHRARLTVSRYLQICRGVTPGRCRRIHHHDTALSMESLLSHLSPSDRIRARSSAVHASIFFCNEIVWGISVSVRPRCKEPTQRLNNS